MLHIVVKPCKQDKPYLIANYNVISLLNLTVRRILVRLGCFCYIVCESNFGHFYAPGMEFGRF